MPGLMGPFRWVQPLILRVAAGFIACRAAWVKGTTVCHVLPSCRAGFPDLNCGNPWDMLTGLKPAGLMTSGDGT
ncbi:MAG: hypothetical protein HY885_04060 [Deltaproteobacteria bacterium]|nr:hypothetical protein [Deltaproteobacteria bacterium]